VHPPGIVQEQHPRRAAVVVRAPRVEESRLATAAIFRYAPAASHL